MIFICGESDDSSDEDYISDRLTSLQLRKPCANECNVVQKNGGYFVDPLDEENETKWEIKLKPHEKTDPYKKDRNLIGEVVYGREGKPAGNDTALFGFKNPQDLECHAGICNPDTQHARLHRELYGKCPEEEKDLVATGFAYKDGKMEFKSNTFNDKSKPYLDKKFYSENVTRVAGEVAQELIRTCTDKWMEENCRMDWIFSPQKKKKSKK